MSWANFALPPSVSLAGPCVHMGDPVPERVAVSSELPGAAWKPGTESSLGPDRCLSAFAPALPEAWPGLRDTTAGWAGGRHDMKAQVRVTSCAGQAWRWAKRPMEERGCTQAACHGATSPLMFMVP